MAMKPDHEPKPVPQTQPAPDPQRPAGADPGADPGDVPGAAARRAKYGLNVLVACLAAVAIVAIVNWIVVSQSARLGASAQRYLRFDLTATRQYSLSEQTEAILARLDDRDIDVEIVTYFEVGFDPVQSVYLQRVRDLVDEYAARSTRIRVEHIQPNRDIAREEQLYERIASLYGDTLGELRSAIEQTGASMAEIASSVQDAAAPLAAAAEDADLTDANTAQSLQAASLMLSQTRRDLADFESLIVDRLAEPLPDLGPLRTRLQSALDRTAEDLDRIIAYARQAGGQATPGVPDRIRERLLNLADGLDTPADRAADLARTLEAAPTSEAYDRVARTLRSQPSITLLGNGKARVIAVSDMYRTVDDRAVDDAGVPDVRFLGEERLTGALTGMMLAHRPLVVFVHPAEMPVLGPRGVAGYIAQRLESANFEVTQWSPAGQMMGPGQMMPPGPPPQPQPGQPAVYVLLPFQAGNPQTMMQQSEARSRAMDAVRQQLLAGHGAMLLLMPDTAMGFGPRNPLLDLANDWGIDPRLDRVLVNERSLPDGRTRVTPFFPQTQWPDADTDANEATEAAGPTIAARIGRAMSGLPTAFRFTSPIDLATGDDAPDNVTAFPLARVTERRAWALEDLESLRTGEAAFPENAAENQRFLVAVAAQRTYSADELAMLRPDDDQADEGADEAANNGTHAEPDAENDLSDRPDKTPRDASGDTDPTDPHPGQPARPVTARLVVTADAAWYADQTTRNPDPLLRPEYLALADFGSPPAYPGNTELFVNSVYWLSGLEDLIAASPRTQDVRRVADASESAFAAARIGLLVGIPLVALVAGVAVYLHRRD